MSTIIIAEAGVNHGGDMAAAIALIHEAARAGADYVKFQTFKAENLVSHNARRARYQEANCGGDESQLQMLKRLELKPEAFALLSEECRKAGIGFLSSPFDLESIELLDALKMDYWKIPSGEITNLPYLERIASKGGKVILSTGMSTMADIEAAVGILEAGGIDRKNITLLHCNTQYPTPAADVNLRAMGALSTLGCGGVGFSDHTIGIAVPIAAAALGACMIEKHFTLDKNASGPDHKASADPAELRKMIEAVRTVNLALGSAEKHVTDSESQNVTVARKSIVAACPINKGELLTEENITTKRPANGLSPMLWHKVIGTAATRDFLPDEPITL